MQSRGNSAIELLFADGSLVGAETRCLGNNINIDVNELPLGHAWAAQNLADEAITGAATVAASIWQPFAKSPWAVAEYRITECVENDIPVAMGKRQKGRVH